MRSIILANGEYGDINWYSGLFRDGDYIICADGGANYAFKLGVMPAIIIGDMDSIYPEVKKHFFNKGVEMKQYPRRKDLTDTQIALTLAEEAGSDEILFIGTLGKRLDHTLSNIYCGIEPAQRNIQIIHFSPDCTIYLVSKGLEIRGEKGDIVSVISLTEETSGVCLQGFEYPLDNVVLKNSQPFAVSNILAHDKGEVKVKEGVLAVFLYKQKLDAEPAEGNRHR